MKTFEEVHHYQASELRNQSNNMETSVQEVHSLEQFNATRYAFFGEKVTHEIELGGLEHEDDGEQLNSLDDEEYLAPSMYESEEVEHFEDASEAEGLVELHNPSSKLNAMPGETRYQGKMADLGFPDLSNWVDRCVLDRVFQQEGRNWQQQCQFVTSQGAESKHGYRPSTHPQQQHGSRDQGVFWSLSSSHTSVTPHSQDQRHIRSPPVPLPQASMSGPYMHHFPISKPDLGGTLPFVLHYGEVIPQYNSSSYMISTPVHQAHWLSQPSIHPGGSRVLIPNPMQQQMHQPSVLMPGQPLLQQQRLQSMQGGVPHFPPLQTQQCFDTVFSSSPIMHKHSETLLNGNYFNEQHRFQQCESSNHRHFRHNSSDSNSQSVKTINCCWKFPSKYMTAEEIESIIRMQLAATHSNDPYVDDYYHQAMQAKRVAGTMRKFQFAPSNLRNLCSRTRAVAVPHAYLHVDALGRVPFSSTRKPRPLLEIDMSNALGENIGASKSRKKIHEQEPMLAARIAIEDGLCVLLEVDDMDRIFEASEHPDGGAQLRRRRQILLQDLAASLQLVDPLGADKGGNSIDLPPKDDLVFLRLASLPKGRKLLSKYIQYLTPGSELARIVSMAVFRRLRFLFGGLPTDSGAAATITGLAMAVASCVSNTDLSSLSACLAAVVCSPEQPPLRPLGSSAGDGATIIIKAVLERATNLLTDPNSVYTMLNRDLWQASFDAFFALLSKYCTNKYDSIMNSLISSSANSMAITSAAALAMTKEMPVELLRATLLHTNKHQRKFLMDFAQRTMPSGQFNSHS